MNILFEKGRFYLEDEQGKLMAEITYRQEGSTLYANHTYTDPKYRGQSLAGKLLERLVAFARENDYKIMPVCSYVVHKFDNHQQYDDINLRK